MKIYTKTGDSGNTSLIGGTRIPKHHQRIEAYGTVDELNSWIGLIGDECDHKELKLFLRNLQHHLFDLGSNLAADPKKNTMKLPEVEESEVLEIEAWIDKMNDDLPELRNFILPGGHPKVSHIHIARCVCRRAERNMVALHENDPMNETLIHFINRLSDFLFVMARYTALILKTDEIKWEPRKK
jgi:cob(I)alamin adenosyltransferase